ncbi:T9SS C-terminal target domain-containing protein [Bacteroidetes/Chlorobi group bacterium ChocPot_Mid]|nr:MAG: T9SS C-terminal target domain-containing protein [Bacteroidetes/Chlorobi group bacterium ChocPot_Mid]
MKIIILFNFNKGFLFMKKLIFYTIAFAIFTLFANAQPTSLTIKTPKANDRIRFGTSVNISWDTTTGTAGQTFKFYWSETETGPWTVLPMPKGATEFVDGTASKATGNVNTSFPNKPTVWLKMELKSNPQVFAVVGPMTVYTQAASKADSTISGTISSKLHLSSSKIYQLKGIVFVADGGELSIEPGTIIFGEVGGTSALCINRGGKIFAQGTPDRPIVFTSGVVAGQRDRGDWGGLLIMGKAPTNLGEAPVEGGIADDATKKINGWFGGNDPHDNSGVLAYVRIEFAGIAESPDNELNGLMLGAVGDGTTIHHVQVSYSGDDAFEWFGGTVNAKYLIALNTIDDDFDTDNGFSGKVQFGLIKRAPNVADISNSEAFESDNDAKSSEKEPFTRGVFCNVTALGGVQDTSWTSGTGENKYHPRFLVGAQIRRNSRLSILNSIFVGWPAGVELSGNNTVRAAGVDSLYVRYNSFYGIKNNKFFYFGSGTTPTEAVDANWLSKTEYGNEFHNGQGKTDALAKINDGFGVATFNPLPSNQASYLSSAKFDVPVLNDPYFDVVPYRGAFGTERWDLPWANYDPVNTSYTLSDVEENSKLAKSMNVSIYPIPAVDFTTVNYYLPETTDMTIRFVNALGNITSTFIENKYQTAGYYNFNLNTEDLQNGIYFLQFITNNGTVSEKIVVNR